MPKCHDFEYDGLRLSDFGMALCRFDGGGLDTVTNGSVITFNTVPTHGGAKHQLTNAQYEECLGTTLQICKDYCARDSEFITVDELRDIARWLNRKSFSKFRLLDPEYSGIYFNASFNISKIELDGRLCGLELEVFTDAPHAFHDPITINIENEIANGEKNFYSKSDEEGHIYPRMIITAKESGNLSIVNSLEPERETYIGRCEKDEVITLDYPMISTTSSRRIQNDFNWTFPRVVTTFKDKKNILNISLPCNIKLTYTPVVKVGM